MPLEYLFAQALSTAVTTQVRLQGSTADCKAAYCMTPVRADPRVASLLATWDGLRLVINEIANLSDNWDGHAAASISPEAARHARQLVDRLASLPFFIAPDITPTPTGTIGFAWESGAMEAYVEIGRTRCSGYVSTRFSAPVLIEGPAGQVDDQIVAALLAAQPENLATRPALANIRTRSPEIDDRLAA